MVNVREEVENIREQYNSLIESGPITKKAICDLLIPFKDKFNLTDLQTLQIARQKISNRDTNKIITSGLVKNINKVLPYTFMCGDIVISAWWFYDFYGRISILMRASTLGYCKTELFLLSQLNKGYSALKWLDNIHTMDNIRRKLIKRLILDEVVEKPEYSLSV